MSFAALHYQFLVGKTTVRNNVRKTCILLWEILHPLEIPERAEESWLRIATQFYSVSQFPNCIEAIERKYVRIVCPKLGGSFFYHYKHYLSIILLALVDAKFCFTAVDVGAYGREGDCHIFNRCSGNQAG
jgi:hypothetical protein